MLPIGLWTHPQPHGLLPHRRDSTQHDRSENRSAIQTNRPTPAAAVALRVTVYWCVCVCDRSQLGTHVLFLIKGRLESPERPVDGSVRRRYVVGDVVGEVEFVRGLGGDSATCARPAHVEAAETSAVAALSSHKLSLLTQHHPELAWHILKVRPLQNNICQPLLALTPPPTLAQ